MQQKNYWLILKLLILLVPLYSCNGKESITVRTGTFEQFLLYSNEVQDSFYINAYLPKEYSTDKEYKILLILDGDRFRSATLHGNDFFQEQNIIVINPGYTESITSYSGKRTRDYTTTVSTWEGHGDNGHGTGQGASFYRFLKQELKPFLENQLPIDTTEGFGLMGHSFGGLFTTYALLQTTETNNFIDKFIIESPSLWWDGGTIFGEEKNYATKHTGKKIPVKVYMMVGTFESALMNAYTDEMYQHWQNNGYLFEDLNYEVFSGTAHSWGVTPDLEARQLNGLKYIYSL